MVDAQPKVLLTNAIDPSGVEILSRAAEVVVAPDAKADTLKRMVLEADVLMVRAFLPLDIFDGPHHLRGVVRHGVGLDMIPMESATAKGIPVANVPGSNAEAVAEHAIAGMLLVARRIHRMDRLLRDADWATSRMLSDDSTELFGRTLGILGMGNVGTRIAEIASAAFRMRVLGTASRSKPAPAFVEVASPGTILRESDYVVLACPLTEGTRHLVNAERIATMKPGAAIVNVARGPVTDERALAKALAEGRLRAAVIDVYDEQPIPRDHPFLALDNAILTPHAAGITRESMKRMSQGAAEEAVRLVAFERPRNLCNPSVWEAHIQRHARKP